MKIPFGTQSYRHKSLTLSAQRCVNMFAEQQPPDAKAQVALLGAPGLPLHQEVGNGPIRMLAFMRGFLYVLSGTRLFRVASNSDSVELGTIPGVGLVRHANDGTNLVVLAGPEPTDCYVATQTTLAAVNDPDYPGAVDVAWMDGYFVFIRPGSNQFFLSDLNGPTAFDATQIATAEGSPQDLRGLIVDHRELWLMKEGGSTEIWYNAGQSPFPFQRSTGAYLERGAASKSAIAQLDNSVFWVGDDGIVYRANGYSPQRISTHAIEQQLAQNGTSDLVAFAYTAEGHPFYVLKKPDVFTFVYDVATDLWHERVSYRRDDYRVSTYARAFDKDLVGDDRSGKVYRLDPDDVNGEDGETTPAIVAGAPLWDEGRRAFFHSLLIDFEAGFGLPAVPSVPAVPRIANLWSAQQAFDDAVWVKNRTTVSPDAITAPNGLSVADKIVEDTSVNLSHLVYQNAPCVGGATYACSVYLKAAERRNGRLRIGTNLGFVAGVWFDLAAETIGAFNAENAGIEAAGDGWYKISLTTTVQSEATSFFFTGVYIWEAHGVEIYTGDGTSGFYAWGAQLEQLASEAVPATEREPQVMLRLSRDGGHTWGPEKWRSLGKKGQYGRRARFDRLGMFRQCVPEITISDPVRKVVLGAYAEISKGRL